MDSSKKTIVGLVQINNSFSNQCYVPYSVGMLQAYAQRHLQQADRFDFLPAIFNRIPVRQAVAQLGRADIVCFSVYVWNIRLSLAIAQELKQQRPEIITVFGGPQIPDKGTESFLRAHPYVDLACHGEGERVFLALLEKCGTRNWSAVPSLSYLDHDRQFRQTPRCERIQDLTEVPSPYLEGVFDRVMADHPEVQWVGLWETNRGCPFTCAYCDWGSKTKNRVVARDLTDVFNEADWFCNHRIEFIFCCDANFSFLKRDLAIVERVAVNKRAHGFPKALSVQSTKNFTDNSYAIYQLMGESQLSKGVSLSLQSVHPPTLEAIERKNIPAHVFREAQQKLATLGIETFTDIILPLPEETYESFVQGVASTIENGQHNRIQFNNLSLLPNALMGDSEYQQRHGFEVVETDIVNIHGALSADNPVKEKQQLVVGTRTMPKPDWVKARVFGWITALLHFNKLLQVPFVVLHSLYGIPLRDLLTCFMNADKMGPIMGDLYRLFEDKALAIQQGDVEFCQSDQWLDIWWPADELAMIRLCTAGQLPAFYQEAGVRLSAFLPEQGDAGAQSVLQDSLSLNHALIKLPHQHRNIELTLSHNLWDVYHAALQGEACALESGRFSYEIDATSSQWTSWEQWCREVIWWGNKRGAYVYGCTTQESPTPITEIRSNVTKQSNGILGRGIRHDRD